MVIPTSKASEQRLPSSHILIIPRVLQLIRNEALRLLVEVRRPLDVDRVLRQFAFIEHRRDFSCREATVPAPGQRPRHRRSRLSVGLSHNYQELDKFATNLDIQSWPYGGHVKVLPIQIA